MCRAAGSSQGETELIEELSQLSKEYFFAHLDHDTVPETVASWARYGAAMPDRVPESLEEFKRPYKTPLYPLIPILAILGGLFVVIITVFTQPVNALIGVGLTLLGLPIYLSRKDKFKDLSHLDEDSKGETGDL